MNKLILFLNFLKTASKNNKKFILVKNCKILQRIVFSLYKAGVLQSYVMKTLNKKQFLVVFPRYYQNKFALSDVTLLLKKKNNNFLKYKEVIFLKEKNKQVFLSTKLGILTALECKTFKQGGLLLFSC